MTAAIPATRHSQPLVYLAVGLVAGAIIALQIAIMRTFQVGSWAHFGSLVVSLAMLGFGLTSAIMCVAKGWFERHWRIVAAGALMAFGPLAVGANLVAQQVPFNAIFLVSDPHQKWRLFANFMLYLLPFLAGATFLGTVFLRASTGFNRVYFADLAGSGLCGLVFLAAMYVLWPENLIVAPLLLWVLGSLCWFGGVRDFRAAYAFGTVAGLTILAHFLTPGALGITKLAVSDYKGVSYARKFPDATRVYARDTPFGFIEVYKSSYLHFAPGLSDNAAFNLKTMPSNAYLGLYIDGEGPSSIIRDLPQDQTDYFHYLPMIYPFVIKKDPSTFVVQFGGGLSTSVALRNSKHVTVAEGNPAILTAFRTDPTLVAFTGDILRKPNLDVIDYEGRLFLANTKQRFDVIDLSLADSAGLSAPGGFPIVEKFAYTREAMESYMRALAPGGVLSVTMWNKEEPPKSVLKLYATMASAARAHDAASVETSFFVVSSYLSSATVLYKAGGFTATEIATLRDHTRKMSFDEIYYPGIAVDTTTRDKVLTDYDAQLFGAASASGASDAKGMAGAPEADAPADEAAPSVLPATALGRFAWQALMHGGWEDLSKRYVFDVRPLTNDRPYFAAYIKPSDLGRITDRLELVQDEWGYLLLWGDAVHRRRHGLDADRDPRGVRLANGVLADAGQGAHHCLLRLSRPRLHHDRGRHDRGVRAGSVERHDFGLDHDNRHAGLLRPRQFRLRADPPACRDAHAVPLRRDRRAADPLRAVPSHPAERDRHLSLWAQARVLVPACVPPGLSDGIPDADGDGDSRAAAQGAHVPVGLGHQRLLLGDRRGAGADRRDGLRPVERALCRGRRLSDRDAGLLRGAAAGPRDRWTTNDPRFLGRTREDLIPRGSVARDDLVLAGERPGGAIRHTGLATAREPRAAAQGGTPGAPPDRIPHRDARDLDRDRLPEQIAPGPRLACHLDGIAAAERHVEILVGMAKE